MLLLTTGMEDIETAKRNKTWRTIADQLAATL